MTAVECSTDGRTLFIGAADGAVWAADLSPLLASRGPAGGRAGGGGGEPTPRPVLLQHQAAEVASLAWDHPWLAVADRSGAVVLLDCGAATAAGAAALEGGGTQGAAAVTAGAGRSGSRKRQLQAQQAARVSRVLHAAGMNGAGAGAGVQCVCLAGCWAAAGLDCGTVITWDGAKGLQQQAAAAAARQAKLERRQRNQARHAAQQQNHRGGAGAGSSSSCSKGGFLRGSQGQARAMIAAQPSFTPLAGGRSTGAVAAREASAGSGSVPAVEAAELGGTMQHSTQQPATVPRKQGSSRARVPPPPRPEALAAGAGGLAGGSGCRQQAWQVLGRARGPSTSGPAPAVGSTGPPG